MDSLLLVGVPDGNPQQVLAVSFAKFRFIIHVLGTNNPARFHPVDGKETSEVQLSDLSTG